MGSDDKVQERRIRRALDRLGLKLVRSRAKDTPAPTTGSYLITSQAGAVLAGVGHSLSLPGAEEWLNTAGQRLRGMLTQPNVPAAGPDQLLRRLTTSQIGDAVELHIGDALDVLRSLPSGSFQTCVTSPPYFGHRDYQMAGQIGQEATPDAYVSRLVEVFDEVKRTLREDGTLWLNLGDSYVSNSSTSTIPRSQQGNGSGVFQIPGQHQLDARRGIPNRATALSRAGLPKKNLLGIPWRVAFALQAKGWILRSAIVWEKPAVMPESAEDRPTQSYEMVFLLAKSARYFYDAGGIAEPSKTPRNSAKRFNAMGQRARQGAPDKSYGQDDEQTGRNGRNVWRIATSTFKGAHFATMPVEIAKRCILAGSPEGGHVLDPFAGAGTTGLAAMRNGRRCTLIELNPDYGEIIRSRLDPSTPKIGRSPAQQAGSE
jgi:site-specific DNA-methyltransferase (adenine-specific)